MLRKFLLWLLDLFRLKLDPGLEAKVQKEAEEGRKLDDQKKVLIEADEGKKKELAARAEEQVTTRGEAERLVKEDQEIDRELEEVRSETPAVPGGPADWLRADL